MDTYLDGLEGRQGFDLGCPELAWDEMTMWFGPSQYMLLVAGKMM